MPAVSKQSEHPEELYEALHTYNRDKLWSSDSYEFPAICMAKTIYLLH